MKNGEQVKTAATDEFKCECGKVFKNKIGLGVHIAMKHKKVDEHPKPKTGE